MSATRFEPSDGAVVATVVRVEHSVTGDAVGPFVLEVCETDWPGWSVIDRGVQSALVTIRSLWPERPERTVVRARLKDPNARALVRAAGEGSQDLAASAECGGAPGTTCRLAGLGSDVTNERPSDVAGELVVGAETILGEECVLQVDPLPMTVEIALVDEYGAPVRGAHVSLHGTGDAPPVALTEATWACTRSSRVGEGVYRSCPPRVWDARYDPFDVTHDGTRVARLHVDYTRHVTRHQIVAQLTHHQEVRSS